MVLCFSKHTLIIITSTYEILIAFVSLRPQHHNSGPFSGNPLPGLLQVTSLRCPPQVTSINCNWFKMLQPALSLKYLLLKSFTAFESHTTSLIKSISYPSKPSIPDWIHPHKHTQPESYSSSISLTIPHAQMYSMGARNFSWSVPCLRNPLPTYIGNIDTMAIFKSHLRSHLLKQPYSPWLSSCPLFFYNCYIF